MTEKTRKQNKVFGYLFFIWFQMFGAVLGAFADSPFMVIWCTGWTVYAVIKISNLQSANKEKD